MSPPTLKSETLAQLLSAYAQGVFQNTPDDALRDRIAGRLPQLTDPQECRDVYERVWDEFFGLSVDIILPILRRWRELEPHSKEAKRALGSYLHCHGPDWDEEALKLLAEANS